MDGVDNNRKWCRCGLSHSLRLWLMSWMVGFLLCATTAGGAQDFPAFLETLYPAAAESGISRSTWDHAFESVTEPDEKVLEKARYQPEFTTPIWEYLDLRVNQHALRQGSKMSARYENLLNRVEAQSGVQKNIVLAIWSMESNFGAILRRPERLHYVPRALATLAWGDPKRSKFARKQLVAALQILQSGDIDRNGLTGSWAGAMGHTQFIPTSYLAYGLDMDGDGRRDIWNSVDDALATAANLLKKNGWRSGRTWGYEVSLPPGAERFEDSTMTLQQWSEKGVRRVSGAAFPRPEENGVLKLLAGKNGPAYLMLKNFYVIKRYNSSNAYALAVGLLADEFSGYSGPQASWPWPPDSLRRSEKYELQQLLKDMGYYDGAVDGYPGSATRSAIRDYQKRSGQLVDGTPTRPLLILLRKSKQ